MPEPQLSYFLDESPRMQNSLGFSLEKEKQNVQEAFFYIISSMFATSGLSATILGEIYLNEICLNEDPTQAFIPQHLSLSPSRHMSLFTWWKERDNCA